MTVVAYASRTLCSHWKFAFTVRPHSRRRHPTPAIRQAVTTIAQSVLLAENTGVCFVSLQGKIFLIYSYLAKRADGLAFFLRQPDMALCMVRHFVSLGLWNLDASASAQAVLSHIQAIEELNHHRLWA